MSLIEYVRAATVRGECKCGRCLDRGEKPDPTEHTADMIFFKVAAAPGVNADQLRAVTIAHRAEFCECDPFDGKAHNYIELGGWIGDQGVALLFMGLGHLLGLFELLTPRTVLPDLPEEAVMTLASQGLLLITAREVGSGR